MKFSLRISRIATIAVPALLLTGCMLGPNYKRVDNLTPGGYRAQTSESPTSNTLATMPWWDVFQDPQLQTLIRTAIENNHDIKIATIRVEEARDSLGVTNADLYPQVTANGSAARTRTADNSRAYIWPGGMPVPVSAYSNSYAAKLNLSYELDLWGRVRRSSESARAQVLSSEEDRRTVLSGLVTDVAKSYFTLLELDREMELTSATLGTRQKTLSLMELKRKHGTASDLEVNRYRAEVSSALATLAITKQTVAQNENALSILLGQAPQDIQRGAAFRKQSPIPNIPLGAPSDLLERRPDLKSAEQQLVAANARIGVAKAAFFPQISLTSQYGFQSSELKDLLKNNAEGWMIAAAASQTVFDAGRNWFTYKASKAACDRAVENYRKVILQALGEVSDALVAKEQSGEQYHQLQDQVRALQESVRLSDLRYQAGQSSYLDLLDAQRQLFAAEIQSEQARLSELLASVRLYKSLGGGTEPAPVQ
jgi:outer membrane protein, multidrug efflux system